MYSSLDRADMIIKHGDGMSIYLQTDHRSPAEIETEHDLSTVFAITRVLFPIRMGRQSGEPFKVHYTINEQPPEFLHQAIASAGGILSIDQTEIAYPGQPPSLVQLLNGSLSNLGRAVAQKQGKSLTLDGLREVERIYLEKGLDHDEDEIDYWTAVVELGAFAGEVMRSLKGGGWNATDQDIGTLPLAYECGPMVVNFMGKAIKFFDAGQEDSLAYMVESACAHLDENGQTGGTPPPTGQVVPPKKKGFLGRMFSKG
jgi:hypothetical protein